MAWLSTDFEASVKEYNELEHIDDPDGHLADPIFNQCKNISNTFYFIEDYNSRQESDWISQDVGDALVRREVRRIQWPLEEFGNADYPPHKRAAEAVDQFMGRRDGYYTKCLGE